MNPSTTWRAITRLRPTARAYGDPTDPVVRAQYLGGLLKKGLFDRQSLLRHQRKAMGLGRRRQKAVERSTAGRAQGACARSDNVAALVFGVVQWCPVQPHLIEGSGKN